MYVLLLVTYGFFAVLYIYCVMRNLYFVIKMVIFDIRSGNIDIAWLFCVGFVLILAITPVINIWTCKQLEEHEY